ncbi:MAG: flavodoxin family protein [Candidatus Latescibacterota bacterium]
MRLRGIILSSLYCFCAVSIFPCITVNAQEKGPDVLIIFTSGTPRGTAGNQTTDAVTLPTPKEPNVRTIAGKISESLKKEGLTVRLAHASEVKSPEEILQSGMIIFGSPAYFNNISWEMKKLIDEQFVRIFALKTRLNGKRAAAFSMAEVIPSAEATLNVLKNTVTDCQGVFGPTMACLVKNPPEEVDKLTATFLEELLKNLKK